jgi:beta-N-acetylhexosaminidase
MAAAGRVDARRRVAGLVWGVVSGRALTAGDRALLDDGLGGVVLFARNVVSPAQLRELTDEIRAAASNPVVVAVDQEGGHIVRVSDPLTRLPSPMAIGATGDPELARAVAHTSAAELAACGVDVVLAPVLDVATERRAAVVGTRAYGDEPGQVARLGAAAIEGYLAGRVLPIAKHFPGHGRTTVDSHLALPVVPPDAGAFEAIDLVPFEAAVAAGAPALMTAHVVVPDLDTTRPASLSAATAQLARHRLGFDGLLVTDALVMDAITGRQPVEEAAVEALVAGADVVMALDPAMRVIDRLEAASRQGRLSARRIGEAAARVTTFADRAAGGRARADRSAIGASAHRRVAATVARRSLTLVAGADRLPLGPGEPVIVVDVASTRPSPVEDHTGSDAGFGRALARRLGASHVPVAPGEPGSDLRWGTPAAAGRTILLTRDAFADPRASALVAAQGGGHTIHVAVRNPVDLELGNAGVLVATYHESPDVAAALADALRGGPSAFPGRPPVHLDLATDQEIAS